MANSIGSFISALRRAKGMTQRELAEMLNVSDKTVSHWERDETAPDLTLIPVIAEIFGVTCDELLRGQRAAKADADIGEVSPSPRAEKQLKWILDRSIQKSAICNLVAWGVAGLGYIGALISNFAFLRARLGFLIALAFYVAAAIVASAGYLSARHAMEGEEFEGESLRSAREALERGMLRTGILLTCLLAVALPLLIYPYDAYVGLAFGSYFKYAFIFLIFAIFICYAGNRLLTDHLIESGRFVLSEAQSTLRRRTGYLAGGTAAVMLITLIFHGGFNAGAPESLMNGIRFDSFEEFKEYAETPTEREPYISHASTGTATEPIEIYDSSEATYYDMSGAVISEEEALRQEVVIGGRAYIWIQYNHNIARWSFSVYDDEVHVTAYLWADYERAYAEQEAGNQAFLFGYALELLAAALVWVYLKYASGKKTRL